MTTLTVWAPAAERVEVVSGERRWPMSAAADGWHEAEVPLGPGDDYAFSLDGGDLRPDPRSPYQPSGVHGPSRLVDHGAFRWTDASWRGVHLASSVIYELHVGTFSPEGTFDGVIGRLDHLVSLGVDLVELMPVNEFPGERGWGYDGVDLYAPHHAYGGPDGLKRLVDACHASGIGVLLDVVYNHLGPAGNYLGQFGPYFSDLHRTPWGDALNFDGPGSDHVRRFFVDNACGWLRHYHLDGLRLDAVHAIVDTSARHFLEELGAEVEALAAHVGRPLHLIAESDLGDPRIVTAREAGGLGMAAQWSDDFHHALHALLTGETSGYYADFGGVGPVAESLRHVFVYRGQYAGGRGRRHGRPVGDLPASRFLGYAQTHDQVGNRAVGERLVHLTDPARAKVAAALVLCTPFVPMLFQGEEWGASSPFQYFTDHEDAELGRAVSEGRRHEFSGFGWEPDDVPDPQDRATFERSRLVWDELGREPHRELLDWHRRLVALRRATPAFTDPRLALAEVRADESEGWLVVERCDTVVAVNVSRGGGKVPVPPATLVLASDDAVELDGDQVVMPPWSVAILRTR